MSIERASWRDTSQGRRNELEQGFEQYEDFATRCAGKYMRIPQDNNGVDTDSVYTELASRMYTTHEFLVDFSALPATLQWSRRSKV